MAPQLRSALVALAFVATVVWVPRTCFAAMLEHYDLTSLALEADVIVRARQTAERKKDDWTTIRTLRVTRTYKGDLAPGSLFEVAYDLYSMTPFGEWDVPDGGTTPLGDEMVFFLTRPKQGQDKPDGDFWLVPSGLRIFLGGKAQRFEQWNNPGGYVPVPQGHDPFDLNGDPRGGDGVDLAGLEAEIDLALKRASDVTAALESQDGPVRRRRLVELCGPAPQQDAPEPTAIVGFYDNLAARRMIEALARTGDLAATLEALSRSQGVATFGLRVPIEVLAILDAAANAKLPIPWRMAAIRLADGKWYELRTAPDSDARVIALLGDGAWEIRAAALSLHPTEKPSAAMKAALLARWKIETHDHVRLALVFAAEAAQMLTSLSASAGKLPIVTGSRARDVITIAWGDLDEKINLMVRSAFVVARKEGAADRTMDLLAKGGYSNGRTGYLKSRMAFDPPLAPGDYRIEVSVVLEELGKRRKDESRLFALGAMKVEVAPSASPTASSAPSSRAPAAPPSATARPAPGTSVPPGRRPACACEASAHGGSVAPWLASCAAALAATLRRHRRSARTVCAWPGAPRGSAGRVPVIASVLSHPPSDLPERPPRTP